MVQALEKVMEEIVVPDVHNNWEMYRRLARIIDKKTTRVFLVGDLRNRINYEGLDALVGDAEKQKAAKLLGGFRPAEQKYASLLKRYGIEGLQEAFTRGELSAVDLKVIEDYHTAAAKLNEFDDEVFEKESDVDYKEHQKYLAEIKKQFPNIPLFGVPGNHDTSFLPKLVPAVSWLTHNQELQHNGIVGALVCREKYQEINEHFNGPDLKYAPLSPEGDDDYDELTNSRLYQEWSGVPVDLMVSHSTGNFGKSRRHPTGLGITKLGEENGFINYCGHEHDTLIYRDPKSKVLVIRPGRKYIAKVFRVGKEVERILLYRVPKEAKKQRLYLN
ncbi:hypothetical protein HY489_03175 [Candidatus Woesearchaeota archaeon]|nr:hypothetical protein [Candidatus Woesearchaeota archaeon]